MLEADLNIHSDAVGGTGLGFLVFVNTHQGKWCSQKWLTHWLQKGIVKDITFLGFFPILVPVTI